MVGLYGTLGINFFSPKLFSKNNHKSSAFWVCAPEVPPFPKDISILTTGLAVQSRGLHCK